MVCEKVTRAVTEASIHARPDKRWLGMLLCAISAVLTLTLGAVITNAILSIGDADMVADGASALEEFRPAAGQGGHR